MDESIINATLEGSSPKLGFERREDRFGIYRNGVIFHVFSVFYIEKIGEYPDIEILRYSDEGDK